MEATRCTGGGRYGTDPHTAGRTSAVTRLALVIGLLTLITAGVGLLWTGSGHGFSVTTLRGQSADIYGRGIYAHDTLFFAGANKGTDLVSLALGLPLLAVCLRLFRRGSLRGRLLLLGTLGFFTYVGATYALGGVAYNSLFLVYVGLFSASLFAFVLTFLTFDTSTTQAALGADTPTRGPGMFMVGSGVVTLAIWLMEPVASLVNGSVPKGLSTHTTLFTNGLDMGVIAVAAVTAGVLILQGRQAGYIIASSLLVLEGLLLPLIAISTAIQVHFGVVFTPGEVVGPIAGFGVFAILSLWVLATILRHVNEPPVLHTRRRAQAPTPGRPAYGHH